MDLGYGRGHRYQKNFAKIINMAIYDPKINQTYPTYVSYNIVCLVNFRAKYGHIYDFGKFFLVPMTSAITLIHVPMVKI